VSTILVQNFFAGKFTLDGTTTDLGGRSDGVLRRYAIFNEQNLVEIPAHLSYAEGSTLPCAALTAWNALFGLERVMPGDTVLTQGTGGVSLFAVQFAVLAGAQVIATTSSDEKAVRLKQLGAHHVVNYSEDANWGDTAKRLSFDKRGADFVIEIGGSNTMTQSLKAVALGGQIAVLGMRAGQQAVSNPGPHSAMCTVRRIFVGSRLQFEQMCRAISVSGLRPVVDPVEFSFEQAKDTFRYVADQKHVGKVVIQIIPESDQE
jgi:NADPH:quinone reductase-like Zn-dependent oxidoreductase